MKPILLLLFIAFLNAPITSAQVDQGDKLFIEIKKLDSLIFDRGFNNCDFSNFEAIINEDFEFYHDQGGLMDDKKLFITSLQENMCSTPDRKPIRKLLKGSLEVHPLHQGDLLYAAIQSGVHEFYIVEPGKEMYKTSTAKFTHLWVKEKGGWTLKRVLSYDHQNP